MIRFLRKIDKYAGFIIILFLSLFIFSKKPKTHYKKILLIKLWAIGDSVITLSLIKGIRETFSNSLIDVFTGPRVKDVYECYPVDRIYHLNSVSDLFKLLWMFRYYDVIFDCEPYFNISAILAFFYGKERIGFADQFRSRLYTMTAPFRKDQHMVQNYLDMLRPFGKKFDVVALEKLTVGNNEKDRVDGFIQQNLHCKRIVGITPGVAESSKNRMWFEDRFAELADRIISSLYCDVLFIDSPENKEIVNNVISRMTQQPLNTVGIFTMKETFYLISKCDVYVSNDTGPMHIAAAQGCRTIGLFGPNTPVLWAPYGEGNISISKTKLQPAIQNDKGIFLKGNRKEYMGPITVDDVFDAVKTCLS